MKILSVPLVDWPLEIRKRMAKAEKEKAEAAQRQIDEEKALLQLVNAKVESRKFGK